MSEEGLRFDHHQQDPEWSSEEQAAHDFEWEYRWWIERLWRVYKRSDPAYQTGPTDRETASRDALVWGGDYYAAEIERPRLGLVNGDRLPAAADLAAPTHDRERQGTL